MALAKIPNLLYVPGCSYATAAHIIYTFKQNNIDCTKWIDALNIKSDKLDMLLTKYGLDLDRKIFPYNNERILLCSDGLYNNVSDNNIESIMRGDDSVDHKVRELITMANNNGGSDNETDYKGNAFQDNDNSKCSC